MPKKQSQQNSNNRVVIVGGGWAGLATAIELTRHKIPVIVLESAKQLGGRARSVHINELDVDNGQHGDAFGEEGNPSVLHEAMNEKQESG